jgi:hypothetical protein
MKTALALTITMLAGAAALAGAQERLAEQLKKGIVQEEASKDVGKAIETKKTEHVSVVLTDSGDNDLVLLDTVAEAKERKAHDAPARRSVTTTLTASKAIRRTFRPASSCAGWSLTAVRT